MKYNLLKIQEENTTQAVEALRAFNVPYEIAGEGGKYTLIESYESSINNKKTREYNQPNATYAKMHKYAIEKGFDSVSDAILKLGGHTKFKNKFKEEYNSIINPVKTD